MSRSPRLRLLRTIGVGVGLLTLGCSLNLGPSPAYFQATDYLIDRTRVIGIASSPLTLTPGTDVTLDALVLSPDGELDAGSWKTCGLSSDVPPNIYDLQCFTDDVDVEEIGTSVPTVWHVPDLNWTCDTGCLFSHANVPVLLEAGQDPDIGRGTFQADLSPASGEDSGFRGDSGDSLRDKTLSITTPEPEDGIMTLEASIDVDAPNGSWSWYVDDGVLLDTGRTLTQVSKKRGSGTTNRWQLPTTAGTYRVVVAVSAARLGGEGLSYAPTNMTWAVTTVDVK